MKEEIAAAKKHFEQESLQQLEAEKKRISEEANKKAKEDAALTMQDLEERLKEKDEKVKELANQELELRKKQRELVDKAKSTELEMARKLDEERDKIALEAQRKADEAYRQKALEKDKKISDMTTQIEELKRKAEQGSMQTQGEVVELELEEILKANFPLDDIKPVAKGVSGADVIQTIKNRVGQECGSIMWESKQTKAWTEGWVTKLKDDQRAVNADIAIIMTVVLPKEIKNFGPYKGIWVTDYASAIGLAVAIRAGLEEVAMARLAAVGKNEKMEAIYNYLSGTEFRQKVEAIVEAFTTMKEDLEKEKRATQAQWAKRDKQIDRVVANTVGMYGDLQGIIGTSLPQIEALEMKELEEGEA
ncbi:MAG: DUF2130 domain-containing protein [Actinomycetota bacterium]